MKTDNIVQAKSFDFAVRVVNLSKFLIEEKREFVLSKQVLRSGTSVGANVEEAIGGFSSNDFLYKMTTSYKEARETRYWLRLLHECNYINDEAFQSISSDCEELIRLLTKIIKTTKEHKPSK